MDTLINGCNSAWPELNFESWKGSLKSLHMWTQIVGKIRLKTMPWQNHSWHTTLYVSPRGFSTGSIPYKNGIFEIEFDFEFHRLVVGSTFKEDAVMQLKPMSVSDFYQGLFALLEKLEIEVEIYGKPNEVDPSIPFKENKEPGHYDPQKVKDFWQAMVSINNVFLKFRSNFIGKCSPVHLFWGAFDLAVTRFSGRPAPPHSGGMPNMPLDVMQEAYSHEVSSAGFWPGSEDSPMPAFYSYCYPTTDGFGKQSISPKEAFWSEEMGEYFLKYEDVRMADDPEKMLLNFLETTYVAAAETGNWDRKNLERE